MSSTWSTSAYPPNPRRSRSRSPPRAAYPPRDDPAYPPPPADYRAEWEAYHRGRWDDYQRFEYARRQRSRSPPADENGRKRRRSMSPYERERYEPRPRYGDDFDAHSRSYGYRSPGRGQYPPPFSNRRAPPDPHTFDYQASLKQYAEWFRYCYPQQAIEEDNADKAAEHEAGDGSKPRNGIKSKWEKYKKEFTATQLQTMFDHHRKSPWFVEKYDPAAEYVNLRAKTRRAGWKGRESTFLHDLEAGRFDPDLNEPVPEPEPTSPVKENPTNGEIAPTETNGSGVAPTSPAEEPKVAGGDDEMQFNMDAEDEGGDHEASRIEANGKAFGKTDRFARGEEISVPPEGNQVMIRTIPPDIGRVKLEDACGKLPGYMYLALGDPLQKRNFYRAGWLRFKDDTDMAQTMIELSEKKIEGFKLHVVHNLRPFVNRVRYTPEVASKPDRMEKDLASAKILAHLLEDEAATLRKIKVPKTTAIDPATRSVEGENGHAETQGDVNMADMMMDDGDDDDDDEPEERGSEAVERRIEKVMAEIRDRGLVDINDEKALQAKRTVVSLDMYIAYLRSAFHTCYYCAVVTDHLEELQRKCLKHARKPLSKMLLEEVKAAEAEKLEKDKGKEEGEGDVEKEKGKDIPVKEKAVENRDWKRNDERWLEWLDSKIALLIDRDGVDPRNYGGKHYDDELTKAVEPYIKQEDEGKFRCKTCQKLFKATSFVEKHIANKHPELVKVLDELSFFNNFALDPHRIQPFAHAPPPVGNSQGPPPQAYGLKGPVTNYPGAEEYGRSAAYYGTSYPQVFPPPYANGGHWDHYGYQFGAVYPPPPPPPLTGRRDESTTARRLSDRITGFAPGLEQPLDTSISAAAGLPAKPMASLESGLGLRRGGRNGTTSVSGPPPPPPPDAKEDPRAAAGKKVSYHDMDLVAEGDIELTY